jgi:hypothetical protein
MLQRQLNAPANIYALADHLDGILATCEDLLRLDGRHTDMEWFLASVRRYEVAAILRVLRVREYAEGLDSSDPDIAAAAAMFLRGTMAFTQGNGAHAASPLGGAADRHNFAITHHFTIGRRIQLGLLSALAGTFLSALEIAYVLYDPADPASTRARPMPPPPLPYVTRPRYGAAGTLAAS